jgi:hypothetical protein
MYRAMFPNIEQAVRMYLHTHAALKAATPEERSAATSALSSTMTLGQATQTYNDMVTQSYAAGMQTARDALGQNVDWSTWEPGHAAAARELAGSGEGDGLRNMLDNAGVSISSIADSKLDQLGRALADGAARGDSVDTIASDLRGILDDPSRAFMVANTEINRAMTTASLDQYRQSGVQQVQWYVSDDPCDLCTENEAASPIGIDDDWPNGDPPVHPNCECAIGPVVDVSSDDPTRGDVSDDSGDSTGTTSDDSGNDTGILSQALDQVTPEHAAAAAGAGEEALAIEEGSYEAENRRALSDEIDWEVDEIQADVPDFDIMSPQTPGIDSGPVTGIFARSEAETAAADELEIEDSAEAFDDRPGDPLLDIDWSQHLEAIQEGPEFGPPINPQGPPPLTAAQIRRLLRNRL